MVVTYVYISFCSYTYIASQLHTCSLNIISLMSEVQLDLLYSKFQQFCFTCSVHSYSQCHNHLLLLLHDYCIRVMYVKQIDYFNRILYKITQVFSYSSTGWIVKAVKLIGHVPGFGLYLHFHYG